MALKCKKETKPPNPQEVTEVLQASLSDILKFTESKIDCLLCSLITVKITAQNIRS